MAMVNPMMNLASNVKDSRWLTLEVCREFQRTKCSRTENECKFAHPPPHVEVQNGRVTACFDSIKGKCQRKDPPCKYLHPPQHLKEQLLQNGRNNLILKNLQMQAAQAAAVHQLVPGMVPTVYPTVIPSQKLDRPNETPERTPKIYQMYETAGSKAMPMPMAYPTVFPGQIPFVMDDGYSDQYVAAARHSQYAQRSAGLSPLTYYNGAMMSAHPYLGSIPTTVAFNPYSNMAGMPAMSLASGSDTMVTMSQQVPGMVQAQAPTAQQKVSRPDRLEVCREFQRGTCTRQPSECRFAHPPENVTVDSTDNHVTVCMDYIKGKCTRDSCRYFHPPHHLQAQIKAAQQRANVASVQAQAMSSIPGMVPYAKRMAVADNKSGIPMYQPTAAGMTAYQQALAAMQIQQNPYIPVTFAGHPPSVPRF